MEEDLIDRAAKARRGSPYLNTSQAAHYLGLSPRTLEKMRGLGYGPTFRKHGRYVRYHIEDLDGWSVVHSGGPPSNGAPQPA
ncbi:MAG: helix-turn-helix domain-containing protein [Rhodospirillaceae bacterium]|jgi:hypothetical protein